MATAYTDTVLNYSGLLTTKSNNDTRLLDAIFSRGKTMGDGVVRTGIRKVNSIEFVLGSGYSVGDGAQPEISEQASTTAPTATSATRDQKKNCIQIFQSQVDVSYLKQSATGTMAGLNIANQTSNVTNELDFQVAVQMQKMKKDLNYTFINGAYQASTGNTVAWKSRGLVNGITTNSATFPNGGKISADVINSAILSAMSNGFSMGGQIELWCNPAQLADINSAYAGLTGFGLPDSRTKGGVAITTILTDYGEISVHYDIQIPAKTYFLLSVNELAVAEMDTIVGSVNKGTWFYEQLAKTGAGEKGQLYAQAGIDYGTEYHHIKITEATE